MSQLVLNCLLSCVISGLAAGPILKLLQISKSRQTVSQHVTEHLKKQGTPTMGGLIILSGFLAMLAWKAPHWVPLTAGFAAIGFIDDYVVPKLMAGKRGLGWKQKFVLQFGLAAAGYWFTSPVGGQTMAIAVFLIVFFSNAYNFADGMDGLAGSILMIVAAGLGCLALFNNQSEAALLCALLFGATIPFLYFNAPPAKVFMGDVGALPIGAVLGMLFYQIGTANTSSLLGSSIISILLIIELVLVPIQVASVKIRKKKIFPFTPIHHAFEKSGWPETRVVSSFALFQLVLVLVGLTVALGGK